MEVIIFKDVLSFYLVKILQLMFNTKSFGAISVSCYVIVLQHTGTTKYSAATYQVKLN